MKVLKILEYTQTLTNFISEELPKEASIILKMDSEESYDPGEQVYIIEWEKYLFLFFYKWWWLQKIHDG